MLVGKGLSILLTGLFLLLLDDKISDAVCEQVCLTGFYCFNREEEAIQLDGLNASQIKEIREKSEKFAFQAEVNRMMKLIINSLYKNKEVSVFVSRTH